MDGVYDSTYTFSNLQTDGQPEIGRGLPSIDDIEEEIRKAEEELMPKREERIDQSRGNTNKRNVRVVKSEALSNLYEWRFVVVDVDTGEILDNAQGYGYKTKQKAMAAWNYKTRDRSKDAAKKAKERLIKDWMQHHKGFVDAMGQYCIEIECKRSWGPEDKFDASLLLSLVL